SVWPAFIGTYKKIVFFLIQGRRPLLVIFGTLLALIFSWILFGIFTPDINFFPSGEPNFIYVYCQLPQGTDAEVTDSITKLIEKRVYKVIGTNNPDVTSVITNVGLGAGDPQNPDRVPTPHKSKVTVAFKKFDQRKEVHTSKWLKAIREEFKSRGVEGATISVEPERKGPPVGKPINIEISGDDFEMLEAISNKLKTDIYKAGIEGIDELKSDFQKSKPEIILEIDREKAQREGISLAQIAVEIRTALFGKEASKFRDANEDAPIVVRLDKKYRSKIEELMNIHISFFDMTVGQFKQIPVASLAKIKYDNSISVINRKNQKRVVTLSSDVTDGYTANTIIPQIKQVVANMNLPEGYEINLTGEQEQQKETTDFLSWAFLGALALMFLILVTQFNSVAKPFIIGSTVIFSLIGVALGFTIFRMPFSVVMTGVGVFSLAGIVIRNGILLIEFTDELRARGYDVPQAVVEGGATRLTPVILTASAAILGLIPLAIGLNMDFYTLFSEFDGKFYVGGDNVAFWGPLAWTMVFGLVVATFLTLLVVPCMYMLGY
ncbi:MAG: efflux RND transporter permease subunit, partial [Chitinophagales bacterium]|nr:efflux RND transporter permease subunit [Chitinophagales bacterium]